MMQRTRTTGFGQATVMAGVIVLCALLPSGPLHAEEGYWQGVAARIESALRDSLESYERGDAGAARRAVTQAYFGLFEGKKMEAALHRERGAKHTHQVEEQFGVLRKAINRGADAAELRRTIGELAAVLRADAQDLDRARIAPDVFKTGE